MSSNKVSQAKSSWRWSHVLIKSFLRLTAWVVKHTLYRIEIVNPENIPPHQGALLVANHVSMLDALLISCATKRKIHFMIEHEVYNIKFLKFFFRLYGVLEVPPISRPKKMIALIEQVQTLLANNELVCIFPEGGVTTNGVSRNFNKNFLTLLPNKQTLIIPIRLGLLWGTLFHIFCGKFKFLKPMQIPIPASVCIDKPWLGALDSFAIQQRIMEIGAEYEMKLRPDEITIHHHFLRHSGFISGRKVIFKDYNAKGVSSFTLRLRVLILRKKLQAILTEEEKYVGILLPNTTAAALSILTTLLSDRTPAILNFTAGSSTNNLAIQRTGIKHIISSRAFILKANLPHFDNMIFLEDIIKTVTPREKIKALFQALLPASYLSKKLAPQTFDQLENDAVLLFSSGSTGRPKAVPLTHHNLNSDFLSYWRLINVNKGDCLIGNLPMFHSFGFTVCFWTPLLAGIKVVYLPNPLDAGAVGKVLVKEKITMMMATPSFLQTYMRRCKPEVFASLRLVITGGEKLRHDIADQFHRITKLSIVEGYGCTELSPIVSINLAKCILDLGTFSGKKGSIGVPLPGIFVKIVDPDTFLPLPPNTPGLMLVKGPTVMRGYLNDDQLNSEVFKDGFYNTSDIAMMDENCYITITGRQSRFSKISGEMVPHELIEMYMNEIMHYEERKIAVCGKADPKRGERLVVFYSEPDLGIPQLLIALSNYKIPNLWIPKSSDFVFVEKIPLLGNGKIDLQMLNSLSQKIV